jgi:hypothetical protein
MFNFNIELASTVTESDLEILLPIPKMIPTNKNDTMQNAIKKPTIDANNNLKN